MITVARKLRPFSHIFGAKCLLPGTDVIVEASPQMLKIGTLEIPLDLDPRGFTLQQDLERNCIWLFGNSFRTKIRAGENGFTVGDQFYSAKIKTCIPEEIETLSFGSHKSQDWDMVLRRMDLFEILPILYHLGQKIAKTENLPPFSNFDEYRSFFDQIAVPKGVCLHKTFEKIRSHFFLIKENQISFLPSNVFPHGRILNLQTEFGSFDMEWTKGKLKRVNFLSKKVGEILFTGVKKFRVKTNLHDKGCFASSLRVEAGKRVYLDRFEGA